MSIDSVCLPEYHPPKYMLQIHEIIVQLYDMGYYCDDRYDIINVIEKHHLNISDFEFPDGSYEAFKTNLFAGKYDVESLALTDDEREQRKKDLLEGKISITY